MAKVISFIKLSGTIDDITFRKTAEGNIAGRKTGPSREKVLNDPDFDQTRRNAGEFKLAVKDATLLRHSLGHVLDGVKRTTLNGHVTGLLHAAAMQDRVNNLGCRYAALGATGNFEGFEFGNQLSLDTALPVSFTRHFNTASGSMQVEVPSFIARKRKGFPATATHFRIVSAGAAINFEEGRYVNAIQKSALLPLRKQTPDTISFDHSLVTTAGDVMVQVLGIQFYTLVNGKEVLVKGGAVKILAAERVATEQPEVVDIPQVEQTAEPFTKKRLQSFGNERRKGKERLLESGEVLVENGQQQEVCEEMGALTSDPVVLANPVVEDNALKDVIIDCREMSKQEPLRVDIDVRIRRSLMRLKMRNSVLEVLRDV